MKTLFNETTRSEILQSFNELTPDRRPKWGRLTAPQMLAHVSDQLRMALGDIATSHATGFLGTRAGSWMLIYALPWPKAAKGPREAFTTAPATWNQDLEALAVLLRRFSKCDANADWPEHPLFGKLTGKDWAALSYKHFRHHLRQFST